MILSILIFIGIILKLLNGKATFIEILLIIIYIVSSLIFYIDLTTTHHYQYNSPIVYGGINGTGCYSPFAEQHSLTLTWFLYASYASMLVVWACKRFISPILLTLSLIFILIGILINIFIFLQLSQHDIGILSFYNKDHIGLSPIDSLFAIIIGLLLIYKSITQEVNKTFNRRYNNKFLNYLNTFLAKRGRNPIWLLIFSVPVFFIVTLILILFGQETNSIVKVFTETATWRFSQHSFPHPIPDNSSGGHYLCTVAIAGDPKLVKPLRLGKRHGKIIVVNRQLLIANAFEELIQDFSPKLHFIIRKNYDKYGFNISKKINSVFWSNTVYLLMKPLEWIFLITLYLFCTKPEEKINAQYAL
ncbi:DUF6688 domain-containing protein [Pedobacter glucosidilyticus]|uniref:DUF6688 domain-containing protein n=1 Tax=Pedobacter glucosidilyticus TaxID=1122941 RepID=UPI0003F5A1AA|nr:DUF6688 family protein [Pedobacter glucosidilyticus]